MKKRVVILQNGVEKKLLSLEEKPNSKDITIGIATPYVVDGSGNIRTVKSRKISIHTSPNSNPPSRTIKHEVNFNPSGGHKGYASILLTNEEPLIWPIYFQNIGADCQNLKNGDKKDEIYQTATYYSKINSMHIGVFVTSKDLQIPNGFGLSNITIPFSEFNVTIIYTFSPLPSPVNSVESFSYTSNPDGSLLFSCEIFPGSIPGRKIHEIESVMHNNFQIIGQYSLPENRKKITRNVYIRYKRFPESPSKGWTKKDIKYASGWLFSQRNPIGKQIAVAPANFTPSFIPVNSYSEANWTIANPLNESGDDNLS